MRRSYEGKMYTMIGKAMDVYNGVGEQESHGGFLGSAYARVPIDKALMKFNKSDRWENLAYSVEHFCLLKF